MNGTELHDLRKKVALSCRILAMLGLVKETTGHVSARVDERHLVVRGRGSNETALLFTTEEDVLHADIDGNLVGEATHVGLPNEFPIHGELYRTRPEIGCVVHAHPPGILMCGLNDLKLRPIFGAYDPSAMKLAIEGVPVYPRAITVTDRELAAGLLKVMEGKDVCLMYGHGITAVGRTVEEATIKAIKLESLARITWHATQRGPVQTLSEEDLDYYATRGPSGRASYEPVWRYYVQLLDHHGILPEELIPRF